METPFYFGWKRRSEMGVIIKQLLTIIKRCVIYSQKWLKTDGLNGLPGYCRREKGRIMRRQENSDLKFSLRFPSPLRSPARFPQTVEFAPANLLFPSFVPRKTLCIVSPLSFVSVAQANRKFSAFTPEHHGLFQENYAGWPVLKLHYTLGLSAVFERAATAWSHRFPCDYGQSVDFCINNGCCESAGRPHAHPLQ